MNKIRQFLSKTFLYVLLAPWAVLGTGIASNQAVLIANHDRFPVMLNAVKLGDMLGQSEPLAIPTPPFVSPAPKVALPDDMIDEVHCVMTDETHLNFLADVFDLKDATYSIGDFAIMMGEWLNTFVPFVWVALVIRKLTDEEESE